MGLRLVVRVSAGHHSVGGSADRRPGADALLGDLLSWGLRLERGSQVAVQSASGVDGGRLRDAVGLL